MLRKRHRAVIRRIPSLIDFRNRKVGRVWFGLERAIDRKILFRVVEFVRQDAYVISNMLICEKQSARTKVYIAASSDVLPSVIMRAGDRCNERHHLQPQLRGGLGTFVRPFFFRNHLHIPARYRCPSMKFVSDPSTN